MRRMNILMHAAMALASSPRQPVDQPVVRGKPCTRAKARNLRRSMRKQLRNLATANLHKT